MLIQDLTYNHYLILHTYVLGIFAQVHQHLLKNAEMPISMVVDMMESTQLTLDVENPLMFSVI